MKFKQAFDQTLLRLPIIGNFIVTSAMKILIDAAFKVEKTS